MKMKPLTIALSAASISLANVTRTPDKLYRNDSNSVDLPANKLSCQEDNSCGDPGSPIESTSTVTSRPIQETTAGDPDLVHGGSSKATVSDYASCVTTGGTIVCYTINDASVLKHWSWLELSFGKAS